MHPGIRERSLRHGNGSHQHVRMGRRARVLRANRRDRYPQVVRHLLSRPAPRPVPHRHPQRGQPHLVAIGDHAGRHPVAQPSEFDLEFRYRSQNNILEHLMAFVRFAGKAFDITYIRLWFNSPRPESFYISKKTARDGPWIPFQYYRYDFDLLNPFLY